MSSLSRSRGISYLTSHTIVLEAEKQRSVEGRKAKESKLHKNGIQFNYCLKKRTVAVAGTS